MCPGGGLRITRSGYCADSASRGHAPPRMNCRWAWVTLPPTRRRQRPALPPPWRSGRLSPSRVLGGCRGDGPGSLRPPTVAVHCMVYSDDFGPGTLTPDRSNEMTDVTVTNRRVDSSANEDLTKLARYGADSFGYPCRRAASSPGLTPAQICRSRAPTFATPDRAGSGYSVRAICVRGRRRSSRGGIHVPRHGPACPSSVAPAIRRDAGWRRRCQWSSCVRGRGRPAGLVEDTPEARASIRHRGVAPRCVEVDASPRPAITADRPRR